MAQAEFAGIQALTSSAVSYVTHYESLWLLIRTMQEP